MSAPPSSDPSTDASPTFVPEALDQPWSLGYRPALDGVRGIAFLMVLIGHSGWPTFNRAHEFGVELFFVLSGLLITSVLLNERSRTGRINLGQFYLRRARRLVPGLVVLLVVLVATVPFGWRLWRPTQYGLIGGITYTSNFLIINGQRMGNLNHLWSLSVEEHFYLFWPMLLIIAAGRRSIRVLWVLLMVTALMATSLLWRELLVQQGRGNDWNRLYSATDIRLVSPLLGAGLAVLLMRFRPTFAPKLQWYLLASFGVAGGYILIWLSTEPSITFGDDYWMTALPLSTISSLAICLAALAPGGPVVWLLNFPVLRWLGRYSYSGYLWHYPVFIGIGGHFTQMSGWQTFWGVSITLAIAWCSTTFIEQRFRHKSTPAPAAA